MTRPYFNIRISICCFVLVSALFATGCARSTPGPLGLSASTTIRVEGSDTMVNVAQAWAEKYNELHPDVSVQISGGGSGVGIASLIAGVTDIANASRKMKEKELTRAEQNTGKTPQEYVVGLDALAVYTHQGNPLESISLAELAEIYGENGSTTNWSQLGIQHTGCASDEITRVSRQNNSGTYHYFRKAVLGKGRDYKLGSIDQSGSKDVVALVSRTPCAIGYSGMGYKSGDVKWLKVSKVKGETGVEPSAASAADGSYPIARPLQIYTLGEPTGAVKDYIDWIQSEEGQAVVLELGYVPVTSSAGSASLSEDQEANEVSTDVSTDESTDAP